MMNPVISKRDMVSTLKTLILRHHWTVLDAGFIVGIIFLFGYAAYELSFFGSITADKRIEFDELLILGAVIVVAVVYFGWRRIANQEREIKRRIVAERRAHELAHTDSLTGLPNRRQFERALKTAIGTPLGPKEVHAVLMLDLNGFKKINDVYGHAEGDDLLAAIGERLTPITRDGDLIARIGGDEFAIMAHHLNGAEGATHVGRRIIKELETPFRLGSHQHKVGVGIGIALIPRDGSSGEEVLRKADIALYRAKRETHSSVCFFEEEMDHHVRERDLIERELTAAIGTDSLRPWYQPIVDLKTGEVIEFEALARWSHPVLGSIPPDRFIAIAEECGLIRKLSDWLLRCAASDARNWPAHVTLSFNISPTELKDATFGLRILSILGETGLSPHRLVIEITESAIVRDLKAAREGLSSLREAGVRIALDDFGTGYSSLYHLRNFTLDKIKIDRSFVHAMESERESAVIVGAMTGLGRGLGLTITAEGIEETTERKTLLGLGCQQGQGYLFGRAVPAADTAFVISQSQQLSKQKPAA